MKFKPGDKVKAIRVSENLGRLGEVGKIYTVWAVTPKVRVTPGTGTYFLNVVEENGTRGDIAFNFKDVRLLTKAEGGK